jgi:hypothetical protein
MCPNNGLCGRCDGDGERAECGFGKGLQCNLLLCGFVVLSLSIISANALADSFHGSKPETETRKLYVAGLMTGYY